MNGSKRYKSNETDRRYYNRRQVIWNQIKKMSRTTFGSIEQALTWLEDYRSERKKSLNALSEKILDVRSGKEPWDGVGPNIFL